jgi:hypothetical protein
MADRARLTAIVEMNMTKVTLKLSAAVLALCALAGTAQAGGDFDDDHGYGYRRESLSSLCYKHPDDARCEPGSYRPSYRPAPKPYYGGACTGTIRAAGKRNLIGAFARNSAILSWQRETSAVHGPQYASWGLARSASVSCGPAGGALTGCVAVARPCRS